jgi:hypothetical protein
MALEVRPTRGRTMIKDTSWMGDEQMEMGWLRRIPQYYSRQRSTVRIKATNTCQCCYVHWGDDNGSGLVALTVSQVLSLRISHRAVVVPPPRLTYHHRT